MRTRCNHYTLILKLKFDYHGRDFLVGSVPKLFHKKTCPLIDPGVAGALRLHCSPFVRLIVDTGDKGLKGDGIVAATNDVISPAPVDDATVARAD